MEACRNYWRKLCVGSATTFEPNAPTQQLSTFEKDLLFTWQLGGDNFEALTADSLLKAGICDNKHYSHRVLRACRNVGIIHPFTGQPDTSKINRNIVSKLALLSLSKQRKLIDLLFFWEEETVRWKLITEEERDLGGELGGEGEGESLNANEGIHVRELLRILAARKRVPPSLRDQSGNIRVVDAVLPGYEG